MIEEPSFVNNLSPPYKVVYQKFKKLYLPQNSHQHRQKLFKFFCEEFTILPHILQMHLINLKPIDPKSLDRTSSTPIFNFCGDPDFQDKQKSIDNLITCIPRHLYTEEIYDFILSDNVEIDSNKLKFYNDFHFPMMKMFFEKNIVEFCEYHDMELMNEEMDKFEKLLILPHKYLNEAMEFYKEWSVKFISSSLMKAFKDACTLYENLKNVGDNDAIWQELILQTNNEKFIIYSFNCRIGRNPINANLWKMLLEYLYTKTNNYSELFGTFSRYCRFFVDDLEMRRMYFDQLVEITKTGKCFANFWRDLIDIEKRFATKESAEILIKAAIVKTDSEQQILSPHEYFGTWPTVDTSIKRRKYLVPTSTRKKAPPKVITVFHKSKILQQSTCFPSVMVKYILNNASFPVLQRLYESAKCFFIKSPKLLCFQLNVSERQKAKIEYSGNSAFILCHSLPPNFCVTNSFYCTMPREPTNIRTISNLINSVQIWKLSYIKCKAYLTLADLNILLKESKILKADFGWSELLKTNGLTVQEFIDLFPYANVIKLPNGLVCSAETSHALQIMNRTTKLKEFFNTFRSEITADVDPYAVCDFIKNNAAPNAKFDISVDVTCFNTYKTMMENFTKSWKPQNQKPVIKIWKGAVEF